MLILSPEDDEKALWDKNALSMTTSQGLSYVMYFYNSKVFGFRAKDEHTDLMAEQYTFGTEQDGRTYLQYHGRLAKNVTGSLPGVCTANQLLVL